MFPIAAICRCFPRRPGLKPGRVARRHDGQPETRGHAAALPGPKRFPVALLAPAFALFIALPGLPARSEPLLHFQQPAMPLAQALTRIAGRAGISVVIEGDAAGLRAGALHGEMSLDAALEEALRGSGAQTGFTSDGSLVVTLPGSATARQAATGVDLGTIVLSATGHPQQLADAPATMTVVRIDDRRGQRRDSAADLLRGVPGVSVSGPGREGLPSVTIRGMSQAYVLFLIDGRPLSASEEAVYNGHGTNSKIGFLPPAIATDRIEIIRGPMSALYGSAASGGVINVITRDIPASWEGEIGLDFAPGMAKAKGGNSGLRFYLGGPLVADRLGLSVYGSANRRQEDDLARGGYQGQGFGALERHLYGLRLAWTPDARHSLSLDLQRSTLAFSRSALSARVAASTRIVDRQAALSHRIAWTGTATTTSFLQLQETDFRSGNDSGHDALTFNTRTTMLAGPGNLSFGYEYRAERTRHDPDRLPGTKDPVLRRWHQSLFVEGDLPIAAEAVLTLGLRADQNQNYGFALTPRAYLTWHLTPGLTLKGGVGNGYRMPALKQADDRVAEPSGGNGQSRDRGNSALRPERSTNYEIGLVWDIGGAMTRPAGAQPAGSQAAFSRSGGGPQIGATLFYSRFHDRISRTDLCRTPAGEAPACLLGEGSYVAVTQYVNEDSARLSGVELTADLPLGDVWSGDLRLNANYTFSQSRVTRGANKGQAFNNLPRHMLNLGLDWERGEHLTLWGQVQWRSTEAAQGRSPEIPAHAIVDLGLVWDFSDQASASISLFNVTDQTPGTGLTEGRRLWLGLTTRF